VVSCLGRLLTATASKVGCLIHAPRSLCGLAAEWRLRLSAAVWLRRLHGAQSAHTHCRAERRAAAAGREPNQGFFAQVGRASIAHNHAGQSDIAQASPAANRDFLVRRRGHRAGSEKCAKRGAPPPSGHQYAISRASTSSRPDVWGQTLTRQFNKF
jgi:hypothetical protein